MNCKSLTILLSLLFAASVLAHPIPDVPVRAFFDADGTAKIRVEVDPRCWNEDPNGEPYLLHWVVEEMTDEEKAELKAQAQAYVSETVQFLMEPSGEFTPEFDFEFRTLEDQPLEAKDDPVVMVGEWTTNLGKDITGYRIKALRGGKLSVKFLNHYGDIALDRINVLFPGETSFKLDVEDLPKKVAEAKAAKAEGAAVGS